jgi:hypothetical protein
VPESTPATSARPERTRCARRASQSESGADTGEGSLVGKRLRVKRLALAGVAGAFARAAQDSAGGAAPEGLSRSPA